MSSRTKPQQSRRAITRRLRAVFAFRGPVLRARPRCRRLGRHTDAPSGARFEAVAAPGSPSRGDPPRSWALGAGPATRSEGPNCGPAQLSGLATCPARATRPRRQARRRRSSTGWEITVKATSERRRPWTSSDRAGGGSAHQPAHVPCHPGPPGPQVGERVGRWRRAGPAGHKDEQLDGHFNQCHPRGCRQFHTSHVLGHVGEAVS